MFLVTLLALSCGGFDDWTLEDRRRRETCSEDEECRGKVCFKPDGGVYGTCRMKCPKNSERSVSRWNGYKCECNEDYDNVARTEKYSSDKICLHKYYCSYANAEAQTGKKYTVDRRVPHQKICACQ